LLLRRLVRRRLVVISLFTLLIMLVAAVGAPWLTPYSPRRMDVAHRLAAPSAAHWFGTDEFGRDVLTRWPGPLTTRAGAASSCMTVVASPPGSPTSRC
jgi:ABC-type dipeptide/oligopeptide/nickel transport system permease subunit